MQSGVRIEEIDPLGRGRSLCTQKKDDLKKRWRKGIPQGNIFKILQKLT